MDDIYADYEKVTVKLKRPITITRRVKGAPDKTEEYTEFEMREPDALDMEIYDDFDGQKAKATNALLARLTNVPIAVIHKVKAGDHQVLAETLTNFIEGGQENGET